MKRRFGFVLCLAALAGLFGCEKASDTPTDPDNEQTQQPGDEGNGGNSYQEPQPELLEFTAATLVYRGDEGDTGVSDEWMLTLTTGSYPIGPARVLQLDFNAIRNAAQTIDLTCIAGYYTEQTSDGDYSAGTFNWGYMERIELPDGTIYLPSLSYYGEIADGETSFVPDLLGEGNFTIAVAADGSITASGTVVGDRCRKRIFTYTGTPQTETYVETTPPNTTLTADLALEDTFTQGRIYDRGNRFFLPDPADGDDPSLPNSQSYTYFEVYLAEAGIDLYGADNDKLVPDGEGRLLQLDLLVPYGTSADDGIPAGTYTLSHRVGSGFDRADIQPFRLLEGQPDLFSRPAGAWFRTMAGSTWGALYGRIADGELRVARDGAKHTFTVDLRDCADPAHRITGTFVIERMGVLPNTI